MSTVSTDPKLIAEVLDRGVEKVYPSRDAFAAALQSGKRLSIYTGIDPTGVLHLGHAVFLLKLRQLQQLGHKVIILIGDFTGTIGDPTDKLAARQPLTSAQVSANAKNYRKLIGNILDLRKTTWRHNADWWGKMRVGEFLTLASELSAARVWERDMFQERLKQGKEVRLHELLYPLLQGYDSVAMDVDVEVGGSDQTVNMLVGRELMKHRGKEKFVLTTKLLVDPSGKKMGKTEGNFVALADSPQEIYGKVMSWPDSVIALAFELATTAPVSQLEAVRADFASGKNPKETKMQLACQVVELCHGREAAMAAEANFRQVFEEGATPQQMPTVSAAGQSLLDVLLVSKLAESKSDARRLIEQGGVKVDGAVVSDERTVVKAGSVVQKGKRWFVRVV